ncbi:response regulator transcription factor [Cupriavidus pinatubonensis]|uniref:response regulator transcription factor n=1 Tax=Cupriavidus pinatubonensis TaxID=248026 RepID=UPI001129274A|nr:response regulator transcription factor [Cupriavidus pinatubonensis]QYY33229.1 response regulator transcription factor [Cupriavidus pinatubonensis]TPQ32497.1 DNA-binding response regulator [Cupriavidus pinatubonensis]
MIRVLIADDHPIVLSGLRQELSRHAGIEMIGMARNSTELVRLLDAVPCDVVVTDYSMPDGEHGDGIAMLEMLRRRYPDTRLVVFTMIENALSIRNIRSAGVAVVLTKTDPLHHLAPAIRAAFSELTYVPPSLHELPDTAVTGEGGPETRLSHRELEVLRKCAAGISLVEIARQANRSRKTISVQKNMAMKKLGLSTGYELCQYAIAHGLLPGRQ